MGEISFINKLRLLPNFLQWKLFEIRKRSGFNDSERLTAILAGKYMHISKSAESIIEPWSV